MNIQILTNLGADLGFSFNFQQYRFTTQARNLTISDVINTELD